MWVRSTVAAMVTLLIAGCGGGGSGGDGGQGPDVLAKYAGTYTSACNGRSISSVTFTRTGANALRMSLHSVYYQEATCTGAVIGTADTADFIALSYQSTSSAAVSGYPSSGSITTLSVDRVTATVTGGPPTLSGSGLQLIGGQLCFAYTNGHVCPSPASVGSTSEGGLSLAGTTLLSLSVISAGYTLDGIYTK